MTAGGDARLPGTVTRALSDVAHAFESGDDAEGRIRYAVEVVGTMIPADRVALLHRGRAQPNGLLLFGPPEAADDALAAALDRFFELLDECDAPAPLPARMAARLPWKSHLAVPLVGMDRMIGLLFVGRLAPDAYEARHVSLLSAFAGQIAAFLTQLSLREEIEEADRRKDRFLAVLAHELRNPLGPIRSAATIVARQVQHLAILERPARIIERQVAQLARLLDDLLDVARINEDRMELRKEAVDLAAAIEEGVDTHRALVEERRHTITLSLPDEPVFVEADRARVLQIIGNLIVNAVKYTPPEGRIEITLCREGKNAVLSVADDGIGMSAETLSRVFDLFSQADSSLSRSQGGLGIGLALVHRLIEMHGGSVVAESEGEGRGSRLTVRLPIVDRIGAATNAPDVTPDRIGLRILLVEDNPDSRETLQHLLEAGGHRVEVAENGLAGIEKGLFAMPEVALIDIGLPDADGYEVARHLRSELGRGVRLIALSGYGQPSDLERGKAAGFDDYLVKPVSPEELMRALTGKRVAWARSS